MITRDCEGCQEVIPTVSRADGGGSGVRGGRGGLDEGLPGVGLAQDDLGVRAGVGRGADARRRQQAETRRAELLVLAYVDGDVDGRVEGQGHVVEVDDDLDPDGVRRVGLVAALGQ